MNQGKQGTLEDYEYLSVFSCLVRMYNPWKQQWPNRIAPISVLCRWMGASAEWGRCCQDPETCEWDTKLYQPYCPGCQRLFKALGQALPMEAVERLDYNRLT